MVTVQTKTPGRSRPLVPAFELPPPADPGAPGSAPTLRDLISRVVRQEAEAFRGRQRENRFLRALGPEEIEAGANAGVIRSGGTDLEQEVDADVAVATALQAFEDGSYYVFVDRVQYQSLDEQVRLGANSDVLFLRLVPLAGG